MSVQLDNAKVKAKSYFRKFLWVVLVLAVVGGTVYYFARTFAVSDGNRAGLLFKISRKGYVFKTYEGQLHLGGSIQMSEQSVWDFSAKNGDVYQKLQQYEGKTVTLHYRELVNPFPWQGDTKYIVDEVKPVQ
jgi:hypothetical protein